MMPRSSVQVRPSGAYDDDGVRSAWISLAEAGLTDVERRAVDRAFSVRSGRLLAIGCGSGRESLALAAMGFEVVGLDLTRPLIVEAAQHSQPSSKIAYLVADAANLPFSRGAFAHVVMLAGVFGHIPGRERRRRALLGAARVLQPGGTLLLVVYQGFKDYPLTYLLWRLVRGTPGWMRRGSSATATRATLWPSEPGPRGLRRVGMRSILAPMVRTRVLIFRLAVRGLSLRLRRILGRPGIPESPRDLYVHPNLPKVRFSPGPGLAYYHLYTGKEFRADLEGTGLTVEAMYSFHELHSGLRFPPFLRELDFHFYFLLRKV